MFLGERGFTNCMRENSNTLFCSSTTSVNSLSDQPSVPDAVNLYTHPSPHNRRCKMLSNFGVSIPSTKPFA